MKHSKRFRRLTVVSKYTQLNVRKTITGIYSFGLSQFAYLPLKLTRWYPLASDINVLCFDFKCSSYISHVGVSIERNLIERRNIPFSDQWQTVSVDISEYKQLLDHVILRQHLISLKLIIAPFATSPEVEFKIKNIRLRPYNIEERLAHQKKNSFQIRNRIGQNALQEYLYEKEFLCRIENVLATEKDVQISGRLFNDDIEFYLCEVPMFADLNHRDIVVAEIGSGLSEFTVNLNRFTDSYGRNYDRIYSRWMITMQVRGRFYICSHAKYVTELYSENILTPVIPKNKKGLGDFELNRWVSDLDTLNISFITINIRINDFLRSAPDKNTSSFDYLGYTYYVDSKKIEEYDKLLQHAAQRKIDVSAIILVYPENKSKDRKIGRMLEHPEFDQGGMYTMPDMTSLESLSLYAAGIDFLAARYSRPDNHYGRIHRWIVHNEVDTGRIWTNMGHKTDIEYMDAYIKSMRLIYYTAYKYNSNAEVLISLTHHWSASFPEKDCYPAVRLLDLLLLYCEKEGDFKWGIAHHPYPELLTEPKSWWDRRATFSTNTELITFKNLEILNAWAEQPHTYYKQTHPRTIILSEQNPNSRNYSEVAQNEQAASVAYVWKKIIGCNMIKAYIAHRWIDARFEGGLKTGLRRYPDDCEIPGGKKKSWYVYKALGTDEEDKTCEFAKEIIGVKDWDEVIKSFKFN